MLNLDHLPDREDESWNVMFRGEIVLRQMGPRALTLVEATRSVSEDLNTLFSSQALGISEYTRAQLLLLDVRNMMSSMGGK